LADQQNPSMRDEPLGRGSHRLNRLQSKARIERVSIRFGNTLE
jgi:hypothetical protein